MPNLAHPLFSVPADTIDADMVRDFLSLDLEESFTLDYKRNIEAAADTVAAMANTYGGIVLIGVDAHGVDKNLPGDLVGVKPIDKDRLVSKMATTLDPPWWSPEVVPVTVDEKLLLVVRVDADTAPRPLLHQGAIRIRLDGRNEIADRRLAQVLFQQMDQAPVVNYARDPRFHPDNGAISGRNVYRESPPDLVIRAATEQPLRQGTVRPRLHGTTVGRLVTALTGTGGQPNARLTALAQRVKAETPTGWSVDREHGSAGFVRITTAPRPPDSVRPSHRSLVPNPLMLMECTAKVAGGGSSLEVFFDLLFWPDGLKVAGELWVQACYEAVRALVCDALPALTEELVGTSALPTPPVELHIASSRNNADVSVLNFDSLGLWVGERVPGKGSDFLPQERVAAGDLPRAVLESLRNIALDWRYLDPTFPQLET
ncbi:ATP-binding protein [Streptomyces sp. NPDC001068]|uniref:ATP-binding protein n=1 Tax=Streptomyces sp. NPDC001068 TaxID=3364544 RepID=UPI0036ACD73D